MTEFNIEHVIPKSFGTFEGNFLLHECVCEECNSYFGRVLDAPLARESFEGLDRYASGISPVSESVNFRAGKRVEATIAEGQYKGASARWGPSPDGQSVGLLPLQPQIGLHADGHECRWYNLDSVPTREAFRLLGVVSGTNVKMLFQGVAEDEGTRLLEANGWILAEASTPLDPMPPGRVRTELLIKVDRTILRAVAKIAFNYFAYQYRELTLMEQFDAARAFIRTGAPGTVSFVDMDTDASKLLVGIDTNARPQAHLVAVEWNGREVLAHVTLSFRFHYRVTLAAGGFLVPPVCVNAGHVFDHVNRQIIALRRGPR